MCNIVRFKQNIQNKKKSEVMCNFVMMKNIFENIHGNV